MNNVITDDLGEQLAAMTDTRVTHVNGNPCYTLSKNSEDGSRKTYEINYFGEVVRER